MIMINLTLKYKIIARLTLLSLSNRAASFEIIFRWEIIAPLGTPVVPDV